MNERIKELAEQAGIVNRKFSFGQWWETDLTTEQKKFAELLIKECALQCVHNEDMDLIEKHFGVDI